MGLGRCAGPAPSPPFLSDLKVNSKFIPSPALYPFSLQGEPSAPRLETSKTGGAFHDFLRGAASGAGVPHQTHLGLKYRFPGPTSISGFEARNLYFLTSSLMIQNPFKVAVVLKLQWACPNWWMDPAFRVSDSMGLRRGLRVCTATNLWDADATDAAVAAGLGPNSKNHFFNNTFRRKAIH